MQTANSTPSQYVSKHFSVGLALEDTPGSKESKTTDDTRK